MEDRLKKIFTDLFTLDVNQISPKLGPNDVLEWDSIGHMNLVTAIEEEFDLKFNEEEMSEMQTFELVLLILKESIENSK